MTPPGRAGEALGQTTSSATDGAGAPTDALGGGLPGLPVQGLPLG